MCDKMFGTKWSSFSISFYNDQRPRIIEELFTNGFVQGSDDNAENQTTSAIAFTCN